MDKIKVILKSINGVLPTYTDSGVARSTVLDYLETTEGKVGLYNYFTELYNRVFKHDSTKGERQLEP